MRLLTGAILTLATTLVLTPFGQAFGQQAAHPQNITLNVITSPATTDLGATDFQLLDNKTPRAITNVRRVAAGTEPVHVIVVVDTVNVPFIRTAYERSEVEKFFHANGGHLANPTTFAVVTDKATDVHPGFSTDGKVLSDSLDKYDIGLRDVRRDQGIWGADERTQISLRALDELVTYAAKVPGPKMILWVSPGWPLLSGELIDLTSKQHRDVFTSVVNYSRALREANVVLYDINPIGPGEDLMRANYYQSFLRGVAKPGDTQVADLSLQVLAVQSGGLTLTSNSDVAGNIARCIDDTHSWYQLTFAAARAEHPNEYHHLQVNSTKAGVTVRTRDGYYAQP